ncbi:uncharacterized protein F4817DRAFT_51559 [Daldinia loculata]|uniref:uncharacterized protein n=1 Tax=Daldinia loculata TaxID=103429 RepID=UPI0020C3EDED|nr:uncharacterized protein F4817DRAFT_51559 [Daldinia loculata]KAI1649040.1 hypothetical protein F4817DRAFT_51559 [Daldinia loculata]
MGRAKNRIFMKHVRIRWRSFFFFSLVHLFFMLTSRTARRGQDRRLKSNPFTAYYFTALRKDVLRMFLLAFPDLIAWRHSEETREFPRRLPCCLSPPFHASFSKDSKGWTLYVRVIGTLKSLATVCP